tara:strand:- start:3784 stop:4026 length:243 start_codon:yes stop_codon:yes gene_type:complete
MIDPIEDIELLSLKKRYEARGGEKSYPDIFALLATVQRSRATIDFLQDQHTKMLMTNRANFDAGFVCGLSESRRHREKTA